MRIRKTITECGQIPFEVVNWNCADFWVGDMLRSGWEIKLSTQTNWRVLSDNDYWYFRKDHMMMRVTIKRGERKSTVYADFLVQEKTLQSSWRRERSIEDQLRNQELTEPELKEAVLNEMSLVQLLEEVSKRQPKLRRKRPTAEIINIEDYLRKYAVAL